MSSKSTYTCLHCGFYTETHETSCPSCNKINPSVKFTLYCSCIECKLLITAQNLKGHYSKHHTPKIHDKTCLECGSPTASKFCSHSCSAKYNNERKSDESFEKQTRTIQSYFDRQCFYPRQETKNNHLCECTICGKYFQGNKETCSPECKSKLLSKKTKERIVNGWQPNSNRGRGKRSYLELSFTEWLSASYPNLEVKVEEPFRRKDKASCYFADFYFPSLNLIIELDGTQHKNNTEYDIQRDKHLTEHYNVQILRISHKEYQEKTKLDLIISKLGESSRI